MTIHTVYSNGSPSTTRDRSAGGPLDRHEWARDFGIEHNLSSNAQLLLYELAYRSKPEGQTWPSWIDLQKTTRLSRTSVYRGLKCLVDAGAIVVEVSGQLSRSTNTYRLAGPLAGWMRSTATPYAFQNETPCVSERHSEPYNEPYNEPYSLEVAKAEAGIPEEPETSESTATPPRVNGEPVKARKPRKTTPKVKTEPSVSERFKATMVEKYPKMDVAAEIDAALNHTAIAKYKDTERYVGNWLRRSAEWAKERNGRPKSTRPQIKADWQEYDFFGEEKQANV